jgi:succinoglycan biosynthesis transport protein ExoP
MTLGAYLAVLRRHVQGALACVALATIGAMSLSLLATPGYTSTTVLFFSLQNGNTANDLAQGSTFTRDQMASYATLATTPLVLGPVIERLGLDTDAGRLASQVSATTPNETVILEVTATSDSPKEAARIAEAVAGELAGVVEGVAPSDSEGRTTVRVIEVTPAEVPSSPSTPDTGLNVAAGLLAGLALGALYAAVREALDTRVHDAAAVSRVTDLPVLGAIGVLPPEPDRSLVLDAAPRSTQAESFRQLRTGLQFLAVPGESAAAEPSDLRTITVTSSLAAEGKSTLAANLALALAETGARVLLVDADLRRPSVAKLLGLEGAAGLTTVLLGRASVEDVTQDWGPLGLHVLASGPLPPNPSELLGSPAMGRLLHDLRQRYDFVVLDAAPVLPVADAAILSRWVDGTIVVANVQKVRRHQLAETLGNLHRVRADVLGVVLNQMRRDEESYDYDAAAGDASEPAPSVAAGRVAAVRMAAGTTAPAGSSWAPATEGRRSPVLTARAADAVSESRAPNPRP